MISRTHRVLAVFLLFNPVSPASGAPNLPKPFTNFHLFLIQKNKVWLRGTNKFRMTDITVRSRERAVECLAVQKLNQITGFEKLLLGDRQELLQGLPPRIQR